MNVRKDAGAMTRAYSVLEIKAVDEEARTITGIASTPATDRTGDQVLPKGAQIKLPLPFLWQHDAGSPIGTVDRAKVTAAGIEIVATIAKNVSADIDKAWSLIKAGLVRGLSIGFRSIDSEQIPNSWGMIFKEWELLEVSAVTIPANSEATIQTVKSFDTNAPRSAQSVVRLSSPGASGKSAGGDSVVRISPKPPEGKEMNVQDQIKDFTNERAAKIALLDDMLAKSAGATLGDQQDKYDDIEREVDKIDEHLERLRRAELREMKSVTAVRATDPGEGGEAARTAATRARSNGDGVVATQPKVEKGVRFARFAGVLAHTKGNYSDAIQFAKNRFPQDKPLHDILTTVHEFGGDFETILKTSVAAGTTTDSSWAGPLVQLRDVMEDFVDFLRPMTIIGKLPLQAAPFNIRIPRQLTGGSAGWVGETQAKGVTSLTFDNISMKWMKLATIAVISQELARFSNPKAEVLVRNALAKAIAYQADLDFIDPDNAGTSDVKPASILNGVTPIHASGTNEAALNADIASVFAPFIAANMSPETGYWLMTPAQALKISLMKNTLGQRSFPGVGLNGGEFNGMPLITSNALADAEGSAGGAPVVLIDASSIWLADDGEATIDVSTQASVQMDSAPDNPTTASTVMVSLWQRNEIGIRAERYINWLKARSQAAQWIDGANYH